jgi:hypothetical protein
MDGSSLQVPPIKKRQVQRLVGLVAASCGHRCGTAAFPLVTRIVIHRIAKTHRIILEGRLYFEPFVHFFFTGRSSKSELSNHHNERCQRYRNTSCAAFCKFLGQYVVTVGTKVGLNDKRRFNPCLPLGVFMARRATKSGLETLASRGKERATCCQCKHQQHQYHAQSILCECEAAAAAAAIVEWIG